MSSRLFSYSSLTEATSVNAVLVTFIIYQYIVFVNMLKLSF
nr:MAG TPA: hypothetical protein [Caudoviricetes sp.]